MEILGLLDTLESMILDSFEIPLTGKVVVDEAKLLSVIDKIRLVASSGEDVAKRAIDSEWEKSREETAEEKAIKRTAASRQAGAGPEKELSSKEIEEKTLEVIEQAYEIAREVRMGADKYADEVLVNLEATSARILRTIRNGRLRLTKLLGVELKTPEEPLEEKKEEK